MSTALLASAALSRRQCGQANYGRAGRQLTGLLPMGGSASVLIGCASVSTEDQHLDLQRDALARAGCERTFEDWRPGAKADRPGLLTALEYARFGDSLVVRRLDRLLGRRLSKHGVRANVDRPRSDRNRNGRTGAGTLKAAGTGQCAGPDGEAEGSPLSWTFWSATRRAS